MFSVLDLRKHPRKPIENVFGAVCDSGDFGLWLLEFYEILGNNLHILLEFLEYLLSIFRRIVQIQVSH